MSKIFFKKELIDFVKKKEGKALDLASGRGHYSKLLTKFNWKVDSIDIKKRYKSEDYKNINFTKIDIENIDHEFFKKKLKFQKYDLILLFRFLHRPLFDLIPNLLKMRGLFFCETFMIKNGNGKLNTKNICLKKTNLLILIKKISR